MWGIRWLCQHNSYAFPRHFAGVGLDKMGLHGFTEWTYYGAPRYQPYLQIRNPHGSYYAWEDDQGSLLSTITWEGTHEGINDARSTATLRQLIRQARQSDNSVHHALAESTQEKLDEIMRTVPDRPGILSHRDLDELRSRIVVQIMRFVKAGFMPDV